MVSVKIRRRKSRWDRCWLAISVYMCWELVSIPSVLYALWWGLERKDTSFTLGLPLDPEFFFFLRVNLLSSFCHLLTLSMTTVSSSWSRIYLYSLSLINWISSSTISSLACYNSGSQTFDEDWWTMLIESGTEWILNQSYEFKVMNSLSTPRPKTKDEHCWYFVPCINIKEHYDTYAFNRILVQHGAKLKWETKRMGWCWFPSLSVYGMTLVFFPLVLIESYSTRSVIH
jgi:hypothetical protein